MVLRCERVGNYKGDITGKAVFGSFHTFITGHVELTKEDLNWKEMKVCGIFSTKIVRVRKLMSNDSIS